MSTSAQGLSEPAATAKRFVDAVVWGEHFFVWDLLSTTGRDTVLATATARGMASELADRLRSGTAPAGERDAYLVDLVNGLRAELAGSDVDRLVYEDVGEGIVRALTPVPADLGGPLPVAVLELRAVATHWFVERLSAIRSG